MRRMIDDSRPRQEGGVGFLGLLTIALVVLKALGHFPHSWLVVFSPCLVGFGVFLLVVGVLAWCRWKIDR